MFTGEKGARSAGELQPARQVGASSGPGLAGLHFHDLRHAGNIWALDQGRTKDLMARMGHDDMRAALIYQRATSDADERIADRLSEPWSTSTTEWARLAGHGTRRHASGLGARMTGRTMA